MAFDPYYTWLGIPPHEQPPNYYRLLGIPLCEANSTVISNAADQRLAHVATFQSGPQADLALPVLEELRRAQECLLDPQAKATYDAHLLLQLQALTSAPPAGFGPTPPPPFSVPPANPSPSPRRPAPKKKFALTPAVGITGAMAVVAISFAIYSHWSAWRNADDFDADARVVAATAPPFSPPAPPAPPARPNPPRPPEIQQPPPGTRAFNYQFLNPALSFLGNQGRARFVLPSSAVLRPRPEHVTYDLLLGIPLNMLTTIDPRAHTQVGEFTAENGEWRSHGADERDVVRLPLPSGNVPREYLLQATFTRLKGSADIDFGIDVAGHPCDMVVNGYVEDGVRSGLTVVRGQRLSLADAKQARHGTVLRTGERGVLVCVVLRDRVWAAVNGVEICDYQELPSFLTRQERLAEYCADKLCLATYRSSYKIHEFTFVPIQHSVLVSAGAANFAGAGSRSDNPVPQYYAASDASLWRHFGGAECDFLQGQRGDLMDPRRPFTLELWVRPSWRTGSTGVLSTSAFEVSLVRTLEGKRTVQFRYRPSGATSENEVLNLDGEWLHIAVVGTGESETLFLNGRPAALTIHDETISSLPPISQLIIGRSNSAESMFRGSIGGVRLCAQALYAPEKQFTPSPQFEKLPSTTCLLEAANNRFLDTTGTGAVTRKIGSEITESEVAPGLPAPTPPGAEVQPVPLTIAASAAPLRAALPNEADRQTARKKLEATFGARLAKAQKADEKAALAKEFMQVAQSEKDVTIAYTLLVEARALAIASADAISAMAATESLLNQFEVDPLQAQAATLKQLRDKTLVVNQREFVLDKAIDAGNRAMAADAWDLADSMSQLAVSLAGASSENSKKVLARKLRDEVVLFKGQYDGMVAAMEKLKTAPDDGEANLLVGKYECFKRENWDQGIAYLAKSSAPELVAAAQLDLAANEATTNIGAAKLAAADAWYSLIAAAKGAEKTALQRHALSAYRNVVPLVEGLDQAKARNRAAELASVGDNRGSTPAGTPKPGVLVRIFAEDTVRHIRVPTPFLGIARSRQDFYNMRVPDAFLQYKVRSDFSYLISGDLLVPKDMEVLIFARYAKGSIGSMSAEPSPGYDSFQTKLNMKRGSYKVVLRGDIGQTPDFYFRDRQGSNLLYYSEQDLEVEKNKLATIPVPDAPYDARGIMLPSGVR